MSSFDELLNLAKTGDESALQELIDLYEPEVRLVARKRLGSAMRSHLDSIDLVQSVHKSLIIGLRTERFDISTPEKLLALAMTIVRHKVARHWRKLRRQQRLSSGTPGEQDLLELLVSVSASEPNPADVVALRDSVSRIVEGLDELEKRVVELRLEGHTTVEVARQMELDPDVLRVKLSRMRKRIRENGVIIEVL